MAGTYPTLSTGEVLVYPAARTVSVPTQRLRFVNGFTKSWVSGIPQDSWTSSYRGLSAADKSALWDFFEAQKGASDTSWTFALDAVNYLEFAFASDELRFTETADRPNRWSCDVAIRQVGSYGALPSVTATYPTLSSGVLTQLPYSEAQRWRSVIHDLPAGQSYRWPQQQTAETIYSLSYSAISPADAETLRVFFLAMRGGHGLFSFTDPGGTTHTSARFDMEQLEIAYEGRNHRRIDEVRILV